MKKAEKPFFVENLAKELEVAKGIVLVDYQGLPVREQNKLRAALKNAGGKFLVAKNTLLKLALKKAQIANSKSQIEEKLVGPTALILASEDELAPLQALGRFIQEFEKPTPKIGILADVLYDAQKLLTLARIPGREVLLGQLVRVLQTPMSGLTYTLASGPQMLVSILKTKGGE